MKADLIASYIVCNDGAQPKILLLKRGPATFLPGIWQMVTGKIEEGESAICAAQRETFEETGLAFDTFYKLDPTLFYDERHDRMHVNANFCAHVSSTQEIALQEREHSEYRWCTHEEAKGLIAFPGQIETLNLVFKYFTGNRIVSDVNKIQI